MVPIQKTDKDSTSAEGWRPVNVISAISKVVERTLLFQILDHLNENDLIDHSHHGAIKHKSTQTLIVELHDTLVEAMEQGKDNILIALYQSKAYEIIDHEILIKKLGIIGYQNQATEIMASFLGMRKTYVHIQGQDSEMLLRGPNSVVQGSTLGGALFLIYVLDMPHIFHEEVHNPIEYNKCTKPNLKTVVDDCFGIAQKPNDKTLQQTVIDTMNRIENYTQSNRLSLNPDKSQVMLITRDDKIKYKKTFKVTLKGKTIHHKNEINIHGNTMSHNLTWDDHLTSNSIPSLVNRVRTYRQISKYMTPICKLSIQIKTPIWYGNLGWSTKNSDQQNTESLRPDYKIGF